MSGDIRRRDFLRGIFRPFSQAAAAPWQQEEQHEPEFDYRSMLPPEFSGRMLRREAARLGGDVEAMSENDMAALVVGTMYGEGFVPEPRQ